MVAGLSSFGDALAFGALNDVLSMFHKSHSYGRPNQYEIQLHPPASPTLAGHNVRDISLKAESITLPGRGLQIQLASMGAIIGPQREFVTEPTYAEDINITFQATNGLDERKFFEDWQQLAFNPTTFDVGYYNNYIGTIDMYLLDMNDKKTYGLRINECYPKSVVGTELRYGPSSELIKTTAVITFRNWEPLAANNPTQGLAGKLVDTFTNTVEKSLTQNIPAVMRKLL